MSAAGAETRSLLAAYDPPFPEDWSAECHRRGFWRDEILFDHVLAHAGRHPGKVAVVDGTGSYRYDELAGQALALAGGLLALGVEPGDVVLVALPPIRQFVPTILAAERIGAVAANVMPTLGSRELGRIIRLAQPRAVVTVAAFRRHRPAESIMPELARRRRRCTMIVAGDGGPPPAAAAGVQVTGYDDVVGAGKAVARQLPGPPAPDAVANLAFTTGSSGEPKGVLHTHNTAMLAVRSTAERQELGEDDVFHAALPVGHTFGHFYGIRLGLLAGGRIVMQPAWDADRMLALAREHGITHSAGTPTYLADLMARGNAGAVGLASLRVFTCAGAKLDAALAHQAAEKLPGRLSLAYGMSEAGHVASTGPGDDVLAAIGSCGRPQPETIVTIDPLPGSARSGDGEVVITGPSVTPGYLQGREFSSRFLDGRGRYRTGDLGHLDRSGYLVLTGRIKELVIRGGEKIPVGEIEGLLRTCPGVGDAVIVGVPHARLGECCAAVVEPAAGAEVTLSGLVTFLEAQGVTRAFWPEELLTVNRLPRNDVGKWVRAEVSQLARDRLGAPGRPEQGEGA
jgi:acyl-CoA synthetase (AMP-forming)/AMP-acid ligase II